jgi:hypothetical protein
MPDMREKVEKIFRSFRIRIEGNIEGLISVRNRLSNGPKNFFHPSKSNFFSTRNHLLRDNIPAAPGALDRATSAKDKVIDRRSRRTHQKIPLLGGPFDIERLTDITNVSGVILQQGEVGKREVIQILLRCYIGERIDKDASLSSPGKVRDGEELFLLLEKCAGQFHKRSFCLTSYNSVDGIEVLHDLFVEETRRGSSQEYIDLREGGLYLFRRLYHIEALMMPVEIQGNDPWILLSDIIEDRKMVIFDPFYS